MKYAKLPLYFICTHFILLGINMYARILQGAIKKYVGQHFFHLVIGYPNLLHRRIKNYVKKVELL